MRAGVILLLIVLMGMGFTLYYVSSIHNSVVINTTSSANETNVTDKAIVSAGNLTVESTKNEASNITDNNDTKMKTFPNTINSTNSTN